MKFKSITIEMTSIPGRSINEVASDTKELSELIEEDIIFSFNGI